MSNYKGDIAVATTIRGKFNSRTAAPIPFTLAGSPVLSVFKDASTTPSTAGVTLTVDFAGITGVNHWAVDTSADGTFYSAGSDFAVYVSTGTVNGVTVVGELVAEFSIQNRSALRSTVAGRTLDVTATGAAGIDWANVENPTTALNLSGTNIDPDQVVASVVGAVGSVAAGGITAASFAADAITAAKIAADVTTELQAGLATASAVATLQTSVDDLPTNTEITTALGAADDAVLAQVALVKAKTDNLPSDPADASDIAGAFSTVNGTLSTIAGYLDTEIAAVKAVTDKVNTTLEADGGNWMFTVDALQQAPSGTGASAAAIADEVQTRTIAGVTLVATVTNLTNAPTNGDLTATMKTSVTTAASAATPALSTAGNAAVADKILDRHLAGGSDATGPQARSVRNALRGIRNKTAIVAGVLTAYEEDDTTTAWTAAVTTAAGDPLTSIDPA